MLAALTVRSMVIVSCISILIVSAAVMKPTNQLFVFFVFIFILVFLLERELNKCFERKQNKLFYSTLTRYLILKSVSELYYFFGYTNYSFFKYFN